MTSLLPAKRSSSFLLVFLLILGSLANQSCVPIYTGVPVIDAANIGAGVVLGILHKAPDDEPDDVTEPHKDGQGHFLRDGEKVEYYGVCNSKADLAITNDRVLLLSPGYRLDNEIYWSIEHIEINRIDLPKEKGIWGGTIYREIHLYPYDSVDAEILYCDSSGRKKEITQITQAIQTQVDNINMIRKELGISVPATVTTTELIKLNEPVIAELRARRQIK